MPAIEMPRTVGAQRAVLLFGLSFWLLMIALRVRIIWHNGFAPIEIAYVSVWLVAVTQTLFSPRGLFALRGLRADAAPDRLPSSALQRTQLVVTAVLGVLIVGSAAYEAWAHEQGRMYNVLGVIIWSGLMLMMLRRRSPTPPTITQA